MLNRLRPCNELPLCIYSFGLLVLNRSSLLLLILNCFPARRDGRYTIFKNLTIIVIAYGEVLWFGGNVTRPALFSFGLVVLGSVIAAWADIQYALYGSAEDQTAQAALAVSTLNTGYAWMALNVFCTASYVLTMRKVIKKMNFKDWDSRFPLFWM